MQRLDPLPPISGRHNYLQGPPSGGPRLTDNPRPDTAGTEDPANQLTIPLGDDDVDSESASINHASQQQLPNNNYRVNEDSGSVVESDDDSKRKRKRRGWQKKRLCCCCCFGGSISDSDSLD